MEKKEVLTEFTRNRLLGYAEVLQEIAGSYMMQTAKEADGIEEKEKPISRADLLAQRENEQSRRIFSRFVLDTSRQLEQLAYIPTSETVLSQKQEKKIRREMKEAGLILRDFYRTENRNGFLEIGMVVRAHEHAFFEVADIAILLSEVLHKSILPQLGGYQYVHNEFIPLCFYEEACFQVFAGYAKATKEGETVSGDNYLLREFGDGTYVAAIADGMGSGQKACADSERTLNLMEKYIESGLPLQSCIYAIHEILYMQQERERSVSLDLFELNQYTGECHFYKNGAASSYLRRGKHLKTIAADKLPLGISAEPSSFEETLFLQSGDIVVLLSDGVVENFYGEDRFESGLLALKGNNPRELAGNILQMAIHAQGGTITDDMTVLVLGVYEKEL